VRLHICGARGSTPAPGPDFVRYGGHTSCVAVVRADEPPALILDAGTGLRRATDLLHGQPFIGTLLLGHLHWDHTQGLPFFAGGDNEGAEIELFLPAQGDPVALLERMISPPFFPVGPRQLRGHWRFEGLEPGDYVIEGYSVTAIEIPHKGGRALGYRISDGRSTITYMSDHSPTALGRGPDDLGAYHEAALALAHETDLLVHDSQHLAEEFARLEFLGHSAVEYAVGLGVTAGAKKVLLFHHDPRRTDDEIDEIVARQGGAGIVVEAAAEGSVVDVGSD
jgi:phosphoribosyl 1,2-cyclic phosphodiesterase